MRPRRIVRETELQQNLVAWLSQVGEPLYPELRFVKHTPNEALGSGSDTKPMRQPDGSFRNVPIAVAGCYLGIAFERKADGGALSENQEIWGAHYARNGWFTTVFAGDWAPAARLLIRWVGGDPTRIRGLE